MRAILGQSWIVQILTLSRLTLGLLFAALAFQNVPNWLLTSIFAVAALTDLIDGWLARKWSFQSEFGLVLDIVSDKCLSFVAVMYAAVVGISLFPLCLIGVREIVSLGFRILQNNGQPVLPSSRLFGGAMVTALWTTTIVLINVHQNSYYFEMLSYVYWAIGLAYAAHLIHRITRNLGSIEQFTKPK